MKNKYILESLASDLKRVALGLHRGSDGMAQRFLSEAIKRKSEVEIEKVPPYIKEILVHLNHTIDSDRALMYSTLIENYARHTIG